MFDCIDRDVVRPYFIRISLLDIDECELKSNPCHSNATCTNFVGGHNCTCNMGFTGDGVFCVGT